MLTATMLSSEPPFMFCEWIVLDICNHMIYVSGLNSIKVQALEPAMEDTLLSQRKVQKVRFAPLPVRVWDRELGLRQTPPSE